MSADREAIYISEQADWAADISQAPLTPPKPQSASGRERTGNTPRSSHEPAIKSGSDVGATTAGRSRARRNPLWWFPLDVNQWSGDVRLAYLKDYQVGWFFWLRLEAWKRECRLPYDIALLAKFARASSPSRFAKEFEAKMLQFFDVTADGQWLEESDLRQIWDEKLTLVQENRERGRLGGLARRDGPSSARA